MTEESTPSRPTLERAPDRALTFLNAAARQPAIYAALNALGYTEEDHKEGWALLSVLVRLPNAAPVDRSVRDAITELDNWDEPWMNTARAALRRLHKPQHDAVFQDLAPTAGPGAVLGVKIFLDRLNALESGSDDDQAALATLARRGLDKAERDRVAALVQKAQSLPSLPDAQARALQSEADALYTRNLLALHEWWSDWSTIARTHIKRRAHLISLGLAARTQRRADAAPEED
jgi:hypothetical protein